jgi:hypothetical protein
VRRLRLVALLFASVSAYALTGDFVATHDAIPAPPLGRPGPGRTVVDPEFGARITRLSNAAGSRLRGVMPYYSKRQCWNADETRLILATGSGGWRLHDGATGALDRGLGELDLGRTETFWHPTDPDVLLFRRTVSDDNAFFTLNVDTRQSAELYRFADYDAVTTTDEGRPAEDGRSLALLGQTYFPELNDFVVQDLLLVDGLTGDVVTRTGFPAYDSIDWACVSPTGNYVVLDYVVEGQGTHSIAVYDRALNPLRAPMPIGEGHSDLGIDANGVEYLVIHVYDFATNTNKVKRFDLATGAETTLLSLSFATDMHFSCVNAAERSWCFVSTFDDEFRTKAPRDDWFPFENEVFAVKVDGSADVMRFAHHRSRAWYAKGGEPRHTYEAEPHAAVNRSADRLVFGSNWSKAPQSVPSVDAYLLDLRDFAGPAPSFALSGPSHITVAPGASGEVELSLAADDPGPFRVAVKGTAGVKWTPKSAAATPGVPLPFRWKASPKARGEGVATFVVSAPGGRARVLSVRVSVD